MTDFTLYNHGSICVLTPTSTEASKWIYENIHPEAMRWGRGVVIEPRYVEDILTGTDMAGLTVSL